MALRLVQGCYFFFTYAMILVALQNNSLIDVYMKNYDLFIQCWGFFWPGSGSANLGGSGSEPGKNMRIRIRIRNSAFKYKLRFSSFILIRFQTF